MITRTTVHVAGQLHGQLWWPVVDGYMDVAESVELGRFTSRPTLREIVDTLTARDGGNFRGGGRLTADSLITIEQTRSTGQGTVKRLSRTYDAAALPSIADYVAADAYNVWPEE